MTPRLPPERGERNIALLGVLTFSSSLLFFTPILTLFLLERGIEYLYIFIFGSLASLGTAVFEVPSGLLADRRGRKTALVISSLLLLAFTSLLYLAQTVYEFLLVALLWGVSSAMRTGSSEALLYESLREAGREAEATGVFGRLAAVQLIALLIAPPIGSLTASMGGLATSVALSIPMMGIALASSLAIREPGIADRLLSSPESRLEVINRSGDVICDVCGLSSPLGSRFCGSCGLPFYEREDEKGCPVCSASLRRMIWIGSKRVVCGLCFSEFMVLGGGQSPSYRELIKEGSSVLTDKRLRVLILNQGLVAVVANVIYHLNQPHFLMSGIDVAYFGFLLSGATGLAALLAYKARGIENRLGGESVLIFTAVIPGALFLLLSFLYVWWFSALGFIMIAALRELREALMAAYRNRLMGPVGRATAISMAEMLIAMMGMGIKPMIGFAADAGLQLAFILSGLLLLTAPIMLRVRRGMILPMRERGT